MAAERKAKYKGAASIKIQVLHFQHKQDKQNVKNLEKLFRTGYDRLDVRNHIPAIIDQQSLNAALEKSGTSADALLGGAHDSYVELDFPPGFQLPCLHGRDRVDAAANLLPVGDKRWIVDLYLSGDYRSFTVRCSKLTASSDLGQDLKSALIEEYACEKTPEDGEFYCKIRGYQLADNTFFEHRWWGRLAAVAKRKKQNLERLLKHPAYTAAFDCQLEIPGLAGGMSLGSLHTMFAMRCDEVSGSYIQSNIIFVSM